MNGRKMNHNKISSGENVADSKELSKSAEYIKETLDIPSDVATLIDAAIGSEAPHFAADLNAKKPAETMVKWEGDKPAPLLMPQLHRMSETILQGAMSSVEADEHGYQVTATMDTVEQLREQCSTPGYDIPPADAYKATFFGMGGKFVNGEDMAPTVVVTSENGDGPLAYVDKAVFVAPTGNKFALTSVAIREPRVPGPDGTLHDSEPGKLISYMVRRERIEA